MIRLMHNLPFFLKNICRLRPVKDFRIICAIHWTNHRQRIVEDEFGRKVFQESTSFVATIPGEKVAQFVRLTKLLTLLQSQRQSRRVGLGEVVPVTKTFCRLTSFQHLF